MRERKLDKEEARRIAFVATKLLCDLANRCGQGDVGLGSGNFQADYETVRDRLAHDALLGALVEEVVAKAASRRRWFKEWLVRYEALFPNGTWKSCSVGCLSFREARREAKRYRALEGSRRNVKIFAVYSKKTS